jgi:hypothetical protein
MKRITNKLIGLFSITIVILYSITIMPMHEHEHHHNHAVEHSDEIHQTDQCHNYIYHGSLNSGCEDHDHASEEEIECLICHHFLSSQKLNSVHSSIVDDQFNLLTTNFHYSQAINIYKGYSNALRGPPAFV